MTPPIDSLPLPPSRVVRACRFSIPLALAASLAGCATTAVDPVAREFPQALAQGPAANIQVTRDVAHISFTNTTARPLPPGILWANSAYSLEFAGLPVGKSTTLNLGDFRNRFDEPFRAGGFFATERPDLLVRLQLESGSALTGFTVIGEVVN